MLYPIPDYIQPHHRSTIERLAAKFADDPNYPALIIGGSVAKGTAQPTSDVDIILIATDETYAQVAREGKYWYWAGAEVATYEGGYIDGKIVDLQFIKDVADHGSETARSAFVGAFLAYSQIPGLDALVASIPVYPEAEREEKLKSYVTQLMILAWYAGEAEKRQDRYLMLRTASDLVLYGSRLVLAYNRVLFPFHKWLLHRVGEVPTMPADLLDLTQALLDNPCVATVNAYKDCLLGWRDWGVSIGDAVVRFMVDIEWNWREHPAPLCDR